MSPASWRRRRGLEDLLFEFAFIPARYSEAALAASGIPAPGLVGQVVPFVSYMFLHGDYTHLAINCLWLLAFGPIVAKRLKTRRFLLFFLFAGSSRPPRIWRSILGRSSRWWERRAPSPV